MIWVLVFVMAGLLLASGFFSGSETALFSISPSTLHRWRESGTPGQRLVAELMQDHHATLTAILLGNNFVNLLSPVILGMIITQMDIVKEAVHHGADWMRVDHTVAHSLVTGLLTTGFLLVFGEVTPKAMAYSSARKVAPFAARPLSILRKCLAWVITLLKYASSRILNLLSRRRHVTAISTEEYQSFTRLAQDIGVFEKEEVELFNKVFALHDTNVSQVMIPRTDVKWVDQKTEAEDLVNFVHEYRHRYLPVADDNMDNVVGILDVFRFSMLSDDKLATWRDSCLSKPIFLPEFGKANVALAELRKHRQEMALVVNEFGGVEGLITVEDIYEEIVGEIFDEFDQPAWKLTRISDNAWRLSGHTPLLQLTEEHGIDFGETESDTVAGLMAERLGHLPKRGEFLQVDDWTLSVRMRKRYRVIEIDLRHEPKSEEQP